MKKKILPCLFLVGLVSCGMNPKEQAVLNHIKQNGQIFDDCFNLIIDDSSSDPERANLTELTFYNEPFDTEDKEHWQLKRENSYTESTQGGNITSTSWSIFNWSKFTSGIHQAEVYLFGMKLYSVEFFNISIGADNALTNYEYEEKLLNYDYSDLIETIRDIGVKMFNGMINDAVTYLETHHLPKLF